MSRLAATRVTMQQTRVSAVRWVVNTTWLVTSAIGPSGLPPPLPAARYHKDSNPMVTLSCLLPPPVTGGSLELRYTTDGSQPSSSSTLYRAPIAMSELSPSGAAVTIKARAFFADSDSAAGRDSTGHIVLWLLLHSLLTVAVVLSLAEAAPTVVSSVVFEQYSA